MEITKEIVFDEKKAFELEMHSVLNVLSVLSGIIQVIQTESEDESFMSNTLDDIFECAAIITSGEKDRFRPAKFESFSTNIAREISIFAKSDNKFAKSAEFSEFQKTFKDVTEVLSIRVDEIKHRMANPDKWETFTIKEFKADFKKFFHAMEQNSHGRFRIIYNVAEQEEKDYLVNFEIASDYDNKIMMPFLFKDVVRDLIANARKYTAPGGSIIIGIAIHNNMLRFVVDDTGFGIPSDEIENVVDFGFRGSNIKQKIRTMGGGFGLTKAYYITKKLNGRMWIDSKIDVGTKVSIEIPLPI